MRTHHVAVLPFNAQTATRPGSALVIATLMAARISAVVRATFHRRTSSISPLGLNGYAASLPMRTFAPLVNRGPSSGNVAASSPLM